MSKLNLDEFVALAKELSETEGKRGEAREICFRGLSANPQHKLGRLVLARLFYLDKMYEFAARELGELVGTPNCPSLEKLCKEFEGVGAKYLRGTSTLGNSQSKDPEAVVAEFDVDTEFLEAIDELEEGK